MRGLISLISRYRIFLLFVILQAVCFYFIFNFNRFHKVMFLNSSGKIAGNIYETRTQLAEYITLREVNDSLAGANAELLNNQIRFYRKIGDDMLEINDTLYQQQFQLRDAKVINVSINRQTNYITLNKGSKLGITKDAGVISGNKLVGIVEAVSEHFAVVMPVINAKFQCTVRLKGDLGQLTWDGYSPSQALVSEIPPHVQLEVGDSVFTSGFSRYFPEHVFVGTIDEILSSPQDLLKEVRINLATDYRRINYVHVVNNLMRQEQIELEQSVEDEQP